VKPEPFIELDRRFCQLDPKEDLEKAALDSYTASLLGRESGLGWKDLLEHRLVVVLGEPGSGKTEEFRERAKTLQAEGKAAFTDNELDFARLSAEDARLATRYAVNELNGFAPWFPELARHKPFTVQDVLSEDLHSAGLSLCPPSR